MIYTIRMFHLGVPPQYHEEELQANSPTHAFNKASEMAKRASVPHFNVNVGRMEIEDEPETKKPQVRTLRRA